MSNFRPIDRDTGYLLPPSVDEWLPERHLARFVVEVIDSLDLRAMSGSYRGSGSASYHPALLLGILVYGYATGVMSSRKLERATYDFGGVPIHRGERASGSRHDRGVPAAVREEHRGAVRPGSDDGAHDGHARDRHDCASLPPRRRGDEDPRQCEPSQRAVLRACGQDREAVEAGSGRPAGQGRSCGSGGYSRWDV